MAKSRESTKSSAGYELGLVLGFTAEAGRGQVPAVAGELRALSL